MIDESMMWDKQSLNEALKNDREFFISCRKKDEERAKKIDEIMNSSNHMLKIEVILNHKIKRPTGDTTIVPCSDSSNGHKWKYRYTDSKFYLKCSTCGELMNIIEVERDVHEYPPINDANHAPKKRSNQSRVFSKNYRFARGVYGGPFPIHERDLRTSDTWGVIDIGNNEIVIPFENYGIYQHRFMPSHLFIVGTYCAWGVYDINERDYIIPKFFESIKFFSMKEQGIEKGIYQLRESENDEKIFEISTHDGYPLKSEIDCALDCINPVDKHFKRFYLMGKISACTSNRRLHSSYSSATQALSYKIKNQPTTGGKSMIETRTLKEWDIDVFVSRKNDLISDGWQESTSEYTVEEHGRLYYIQTFTKNNSNSGKFDTVKIEEWDIDVFNSKLSDYLSKGWVTSGQLMQIDRFGKKYHIVTLKKSY